MNLNDVVKKALQDKMESSIRRYVDQLVLDTMHEDAQFIRLKGTEVVIHSDNDAHMKLDGETTIRGSLRLLSSPDQLKFGQIHKASSQLLSMIPSTGVTPVPVLQPYNPVGPILTLLKLLQ